MHIPKGLPASGRGTTFPPRLLSEVLIDAAHKTDVAHLRGLGRCPTRGIGQARLVSNLEDEIRPIRPQTKLARGQSHLISSRQTRHVDNPIKNMSGFKIDHEI